MTDEPYPPLRPQPRAGRRNSPPWALIIGVIVLAGLAVVAALLVLNEDQPAGAASSPTPSASASTLPSQSASSSASASAHPTAASSDGAAQAFEVDDVVETAVDALALRTAPGLDGHLTWRLRESTKGIVIGGPVEADGYTWYQLSGMGLPYGSGCITPEEGEILDCPAFLGWVAGTGTDGSSWLTASTPEDCPSGAPDVEVLAGLPFTMRLLCYGSDELTFVAYWPELPTDDNTGGSCPGIDTTAGWLVCQNVNDTVLAAGESGASFPVNVDPGSGVAMPDRGQWVEVVGHFDDAAAQDCGSAADAMDQDANALVFGCRWQFVLSSVSVTSAPSE